MADQKRWFKLWCSAPSDDDLQSLPVADRWAWAVFGCYTKLHGTNGRVSVSPSNAVLAAELGVPSCDLIATLKRLPHMHVEEGITDNGRVTVTWENWQKYQEDSTVYERVKRLRSKRRGEEKREEEKRRDPPIVPPEGGTRAFKAEARDVLGWLNEKVGKRFEFIPANLGPIEARLREGREVWQLKKVVSVKAKAWATDEKMREYLRPATLFNKTKCAQYVGELPAGGVE